MRRATLVNDGVAVNRVVRQVFLTVRVPAQLHGTSTRGGHQAGGHGRGCHVPGHGTHPDRQLALIGTTVHRAHPVPVGGAIRYARIAVGGIGCGDNRQQGCSGAVTDDVAVNGV
ncbi:hypothetical protein ES703_04146 [subsurface metagenome]